jgi:IS1 family transposase
MIWQAIDHHTGQMLAYVMGNRADQAFLALQAPLKPFGMTHDITRTRGAPIGRYLPPEQHVIGKRPMQKIERRDQLN